MDSITVKQVALLKAVLVWFDVTGRIIATSHDLTSEGSRGREILFFREI